MKFLVLFILLFSQININAQVAETFCSSNLLELDEEEMLFPRFGPVGTLKILVFLVKFSDDDFLAPPITDPLAIKYELHAAMGSHFSIIDCAV